MPKFKELPWYEVVDRVAPSVVRIQTPAASGTGFVVSMTANPTDVHDYFIATARHVIEDLIQADEDVEITSFNGEKKFSSASSYVGLYSIGSEVFDTVLLHCSLRESLLEKSDLLPIFPTEEILARGSQIGWLGFPGIAGTELCFFSGHISGYKSDPPAYLVDGIAINGVSGGPVFDNRCHLIGMISAYIPNITENFVLPGLASIIPINAIRFALENSIKARVI